MLTTLLALTLAAPAAPADPFADDADKTRILGVGVSTCAANMAKENDDGPVAWVFGFWTGLNAAFRARDVRALRSVADPIGPEADRYLREIFAEADIIIPCWGPLSKLPKSLHARWREVADIMFKTGKPVLCFGTSLDGQPLHTLTLAYATPLIPWERPE